MTNSAKFIARFDLSGPEEFCNTIAANDAALRYRIEALRATLDGAQSHHVPQDAMTHNTVLLLERVIRDLDEQASNQLHVLHMDGFSVREDPTDLDALYEFLLDTNTPGSRYDHHMAAFDRFIAQLSALDNVLYLELKRFKSFARPSDDLFL